MQQEDIFRRLRLAARSGDIACASPAELAQFSAALCHSNAHTYFGQNEFQQISNAVQTQLLRAHIEELQNHITELNKRNSVATYCVIALTIASLIGSGLQTWFGYTAYKTSAAETAPTAEPRTPSQSAASAPSRGQPQALNQATSTPKDALAR